MAWQNIRWSDATDNHALRRIKLTSIKDWFRRHGKEGGVKLRHLLKKCSTSSTRNFQQGQGIKEVWICRGKDLVLEEEFLAKEFWDLQLKENIKGHDQMNEGIWASTSSPFLTCPKLRKGSTTIFPKF